MARIVVLAQDFEPLAARLDRFGIGERKRHLEIGFEDVLGRRQDVGDEVFAENDLAIDIAADLERVERVLGRGQHHEAARDQHATGDLGQGSEFHGYPAEKPKSLGKRRREALSLY